MFNFLLDVYNGGVVGNSVSPDNNPDGIANGIDYQLYSGMLLILAFILSVLFIFFCIKYYAIKEKYEELKSKETSNVEEEHK